MKKIVILITLIFVTILSGCSKKEEEIPEVNKTDEVLRYIKELKTFKAKVKVTYFTNTSEQVFEMTQEGDIDGRYKIEILKPENLAKNISMNDGESLYQINEQRAKKIYVSANDFPERVQILLTSFLNNYINNTDGFSKIGELNNGEIIILEGSIPGENTFFATEQLTLDGDTYAPIKLDIYKTDGSKFVEVEYLEFGYNPSFGENYFTPIIK